MFRLSTTSTCGNCSPQRLVLRVPLRHVATFRSRALFVCDEPERTRCKYFYWFSSQTRSFSNQHTSPSRGVDFTAVKLGVGKIVATAVPISSENTTFATQLSTVSHKSPVRLIPTTTSAFTRAKQVSVGHYGGGMTAGDEATIDIVVQKNARLHVRTQGINRIYGHGNQQPYRIRGSEQSNATIPPKVSINSVEATVEEHGLLVYAPDPVSLHTGARYQQCTNFVLKDTVTSNLVAVDWICSGRRYATESEHWNHQYCTTRTTLRFQEQSIPTLIDAQSITAEGMYAFATLNHQFHAVASVILSGSMVVGGDDENGIDSVVQRFFHLQSALATPYTAIRTSNYDSEKSNNVKQLLNEQLSEGGRVIIGISKAVATNNSATPSIPVYTIRIASTSNEDIYRILHYSLLPIAPHLDGNECYKDRIVTASRSPPTLLLPLLPQRNTPKTTTIPHASIFGSEKDSNRSNYWAAYMLGDSALPIGSFAHSSGIEVANQLGFLKSNSSNDGITAYVRAAVISTMQLSTPLLWCSSHLTKDLIQQLSALKHIDDGEENQAISDAFLREYIKIDLYAQALLITNGPSCRASLDQGKNLWRVALSTFLTSPESKMTDHALLCKIIAILESVIDSSEQAGHMTTVLGVVSRLLQLAAQDATRLYGYCVARDVVNAAVRLNLIGPMEGQTILLHHAQQASSDGIFRSEAAIASSFSGEPKSFYEGMNSESLQSMLSASIGSAPILDSIHPCHDILATRLFRT